MNLVMFVMLVITRCEVALKEIIEEGVISEISLNTEEGVITWTSSFINIHLSLVMLL
jgi:hypothetical protein